MPHTALVYNVCAVHHAILVTGLYVTEDLMQNLTEQGVSFTAAAEREIAREVRETALLRRGL